MALRTRTPCTPLASDNTTLPLPKETFAKNSLSIISYIAAKSTSITLAAPPYYIATPGAARRARRVSVEHYLSASTLRHTVAKGAPRGIKKLKTPSADRKTTNQRAEWPACAHRRNRPRTLFAYRKILKAEKAITGSRQAKILRDHSPRAIARSISHQRHNQIYARCVVKKGGTLRHVSACNRMHRRHARSEIFCAAIYLQTSFPGTSNLEKRNRKGLRHAPAPLHTRRTGGVIWRRNGTGKRYIAQSRAHTLPGIVARQVKEGVALVFQRRNRAPRMVWAPAHRTRIRRK